MIYTLTLHWEIKVKHNFTGSIEQESIDMMWQGCVIELWSDIISIDVFTMMGEG